MTGTYRSDQVAAVVVGCSLNGLGVLRSLAHARIPITAVGTKRTESALWSRHASARLVRSYSGHAFIEDMIRLGKEFSRPPMLFLTDEIAVHSVSENRDQLSKWFRFRLPDDACVKTLTGKVTFHEFSLRHGFPVPRSVFLAEPSDLAQLAQLRYPCVLKPDDKRNALSGKMTRAVRVQSLSKARQQASLMLSARGGIIAQEWIEGPDSNIYFTLFYRGAGGQPVAIFTGRKLLSYPRHVGSTAICVAAPEVRATLEPMTLAFADRAGLDGMASMEYKWDDNHKLFSMVEPTVGRTDWQEEIATLCGVNIPVAAYRHELGLPPIPVEANRVPAAWRATVADRLARHVLTADTRVVDGFFRWDDPLPALQYYCVINPLRHLTRGWDLKRQISKTPKTITGGVNDIN